MRNDTAPLFTRTVRKIARFFGRRLETPRCAWWDEGLPFRTVPVHGHDICYVTAGQGPPVVLVHGFGTSLAVWARQIRVLSRDCQVFALDLPGHGFSEKPDLEYRPRFYTDALRGFLDALGITAASFVGHSMGGLLSLCLAMEAPDRVRHLVLVNSSSPLFRPSRLLRLYEKRRRRPWLWNRVMELIEVLIPLLPASFEARGQGKITHRADAVPPEWSKQMVAFRRSKGFSRMAVSTMTHWVDVAAYENGMKEILHPVLVVCGALDRVIPLAHGRQLQETLPNATQEVIPECGHMAPLEEPDRTARAILAFLRAGPRAGEGPTVS